MDCGVASLEPRFGDTTLGARAPHEVRKRVSLHLSNQRNGSAMSLAVVLGIGKKLYYEEDSLRTKIYEEKIAALDDHGQKPGGEEREEGDTNDT